MRFPASATSILLFSGLVRSHLHFTARSPKEVSGHLHFTAKGLGTGLLHFIIRGAKEVRTSSILISEALYEVRTSSILLSEALYKVRTSSILLSEAPTMFAPPPFYCQRDLDKIHASSILLSEAPVMPMGDLPYK